MTNINLENFINTAADQMIASVEYAIEHKDDDRSFNWFDWATDRIDDSYQNVLGVLIYLHNYIYQTISDEEYDRLTRQNRVARMKARELAVEKLI